MSSTRKRKTAKQTADSQQHETLASVCHQSAHATINGMIINLSAMIRSTTTLTLYYHGQITDSSVTMRVVGFDSTTHAALAERHRNRQAVNISNCQVKRGRQSELEVILNRFTRVTTSSHQFHVPEEMFRPESQSVSLEDVPSLKAFQRITVSAKVVKRYRPEIVKNGKTKRDVIISDDTSPMVPTLREGDIDRLEDHKSYSFSNVVVRLFAERPYISLPKSDATVEEIDDIRDVKDYDSDAYDLIHEDWRIIKTHDYTLVHTGRIIAVYSLTQYHACTKCNSKIPPPESDNDTDVACCPKCSTSQRFSLSPTHHTARLLVQVDSLGDTTTKTVQAFDTTIYI